MPGHIELIKYIDSNENANQNRTVIEIGSTREFMPGHNSSEALILSCMKHNMRFISVDMDISCSENVINIAKKHNFTNYEVHTMKGEDFLQNYNEPIYYIYLDAFDFYHGGHSDERKSKYEKYLSCEITPDDTLCHEMHLQCCKNIIGKCNDKTIIVFDDILDDNKRGKGVTAVPYLVDNGFKIIEYSKKHHSMVLTL